MTENRVTKFGTCDYPEAPRSRNDLDPKGHSQS